uniref:Uncharacterized protein n=2 Tax=Micrurus corallinus TaxID=54390 RepID=A0A2D4EUA3_MICCO
MSSWPKVTTDQAQTPDPEKRQRPGWIPRLLDINPYKSIQKSSYSPADGYPKDHEDVNSFEELFGQQYHPTENEVNYERHQYPQKDDTKDAHRDKLYLQFYQQIEKEYNRERPSDCVIVSISKDQATASWPEGQTSPSSHKGHQKTDAPHSSTCPRKATTARGQTWPATYTHYLQVRLSSTLWLDSLLNFVKLLIQDPLSIRGPLNQSSWLERTPELIRN